MVFKRIIVVVLFLLISIPSWAADTLFYIRAGATGTYATTQCDSWAADRACDDLPATLSRGTTGATYYIGNGSYEGYHFSSSSAAIDGTKVITIKKATVADHGTGTGWDNAYAAQAVFQYSTSGTTPYDIKLTTFKITTSYITIDGSVGSGNNPDDYGFKMVMGAGIDNPANPLKYWAAVLVGGLDSTYKNNTYEYITVKHIAAYGPTSEGDFPDCINNISFKCDCNGISTYLTNGVGWVRNFTIESNLLGYWNNNISILQGADLSIHDNYLYHNYSNDAAYPTGTHGQNVNLGFNINNAQIYNNTFKESQTFLIALHASSSPATHMTGVKVFNNIFDSINLTRILINPGQSALSGGMGVMSDSEIDSVQGMEVMHNTFVNIPFGGKGVLRVGQLTTYEAPYISSVYNNLLYGCTTANLTNGTYSNALVHDYNAYLSTTGNTAETHGQVDPEAESPFNTGVYTISTTWDAAQVTAEKASLIGKGKTDLGSPYDVDMAGNSRDASPDIGAFESGASADTTAPTLAEVTPVTASSSNQAPVYVFSSDEAGTVTYGGTCGNGSLSTAIVGNNSTSWNLPVGTYSDCTVTVTDAALNASTPLAITEFVITPVISSASKVIEGGVTFMRLP